MTQFCLVIKPFYTTTKFKLQSLVKFDPFLALDYVISPKLQFFSCICPLYFKLCGNEIVMLDLDWVLIFIF